MSCNKCGSGISREDLKNGDYESRAGLLFCDSDCADEWVAEFMEVW